jgi:hypothetical protein
MLGRLTGVLCAIAFGALLFFLGALILHPSYWPAPSRGEAVQQKYAHSQPPDQKGSRDAAPPQQPLFAVEVISAEKSAAERAEEARDRQAKATSEGRLTWSTIVIAIFTVVLAITSGLQYCAIMASIRESRRAATVQAGLTRRAIKVSRDEFEMAHSPKIAITRISTVRIVSGQLVSAILDILNQGDADAILIESGSDIFVRPKPPYSPVTFDANSQPYNPRITLKPGDEFAFGILGSRSLSIQEVNDIVAGVADLCFIGSIKYIGAANTVRVDKFFRIFDHRIGCFRRAKNAAERREWDYPN